MVKRFSSRAERKTTSGELRMIWVYYMEKMAEKYQNNVVAIPKVKAAVERNEDVKEKGKKLGEEEQSTPQIEQQPQKEIDPKEEERIAAEKAAEEERKLREEGEKRKKEEEERKRKEEEERRKKEEQRKRKEPAVAATKPAKSRPQQVTNWVNSNDSSGVLIPEFSTSSAKSNSKKPAGKNRNAKKKTKKNNQKGRRGAPAQRGRRA